MGEKNRWVCFREDGGHQTLWYGHNEKRVFTANAHGRVFVLVGEVEGRDDGAGWVVMMGGFEVGAFSRRGAAKRRVEAEAAMCFEEAVESLMQSERDLGWA